MSEISSDNDANVNVPSSTRAGIAKTAVSARSISAPDVGGAGTRDSQQDEAEDCEQDERPQGSRLRIARSEITAKEGVANRRSRPIRTADQRE